MAFQIAVMHVTYVKFEELVWRCPQKRNLEIIYYFLLTL